MFLIIGKIGYLSREIVMQRLQTPCMFLFNYDAKHEVSDSNIEHSDLTLLSEVYSPTKFLGSQDWMMSSHSNISTDFFLSPYYFQAYYQYESTFRHQQCRLSINDGLTSLNIRESFHVDLDKARILLLSNNITGIVFSHVPHNPFHVSLYYQARHLGLTVYSYRDSFFAYGSRIEINEFDQWPYVSPNSILPTYQMSSSLTPTISPSSSIRKQTLAALLKMKSHPETQRSLVPESNSNTLSNNPPDLSLQSLESDLFQSNSTEDAVQKSSVSPTQYTKLDSIFNFRGSEVTNSLISQQFINPSSTSFDSVQLPLSENFVLMTLTYQPEASTTVYGRLFEDQLAFIRRLLSLIPNNWKLLIKDHPFNRADSEVPKLTRNIQRWSSYYDHKQLIFAPFSANTHELIKACRCLAVVSGSSGMEALEVGKKVIYGGDVEYKYFQGAVNIIDLLTKSAEDPQAFLTWLQSPINSDSYSTDLNKLRRELFRCFAYLKSTDFDVSIEENAVFLSKSLSFIARHYQSNQ